MKRVNCQDCGYFEDGTQTCHHDPTTLRKDPNDWCGQGWPDYDLDPNEVRKLQGYLATIYPIIREIEEAVNEHELRGIAEEYEYQIAAWVLGVSELLGEPQTAQQPVMPSTPVEAPEPSTWDAHRYVVLVHHLPVDSTDTWWDEAESLRTESVTNMPAVAARQAFDLWKAKGGVPGDGVDLYYHCQVGWSGRLVYRWEVDWIHFGEGIPYSEFLPGEKHPKLYYHCEIRPTDEDEPCTT